MKRLLITLLFILFVSNKIYSDLNIARIHYEGGGDWYNDAEVIPNLINFMNKKTPIKFKNEQKILKLSDLDIMNYPFLYITGHGNISLTDSEIINFKKYVNRNGFIYIDDDFGFDKSIRRELKRVFPDKNLIELPSNHKIFSSYYEFPDGLPKIHKHEDKRPQAFGLFDEFGRLFLLYTYESNISDGWASPQTHKDPPEVRQKALKMGMNILYYLITE